MAIEERPHLGPAEVEIDTPLYGIMLVGDDGQPVMTIKLYDSKEKALRKVDAWNGFGRVVRIKGTNGE